ncbi:hypothetical protein KIPB_014685, partial [Kipferlia bialata]
RAGRIIKLQQGEYVNLESIEDRLGAVPVVSQMFAYAEPTEAYTVAVICPDPAVLRMKCAEAGLPANDDFAALCADPAVVQLVLDEITREGKAMNMWGYERPRYVHLESEDWTPDNCLTPTYKKRLAVIRQTYAEQLAAMY